IAGATEVSDDSANIFSNVIDNVVRFAPCPVMVVKSGGVDPDTWAPRRLLVPTNGSRASRNAAEVAFQLAGTEEDGNTTILNVATGSARASSRNFSLEQAKRQEEQAQEIVESLQK